MKNIIKHGICLAHLMGFLIIGGCNNTQLKKDTVESIVQKTDNAISIINLIATPEKYHKKTVKVKGFITLEFEASAVYMHKADHDLSIDKNGIWIEISRKEMEKNSHIDKKYGIIEGVFDMINKGHEGAYNGAISDIMTIKAIKQ